MAITMYHGSRGWSGFPEVQEQKRGAEHGPGIYCTTRLDTATRYAKGGGNVVKFELDANLQLLTDTSVAFDDVECFLKSSKISRRKILLDDLTRYHLEYPSEKFSLNVLVNLAVNNNCVTGKGGVELAGFVAAAGADASLYSRNSEDWLVIFNPKIIKSYKKLYASELDWDQSDLPSVREQISAVEEGLAFSQALRAA